MQLPRVYLHFMIACASLIAASAPASAQTQSSQVLASTKLNRLLRIPTITVATDAGEFVAALDTGGTGVALEPLVASMHMKGDSKVPVHAEEIPLPVKLQIGKLTASVAHVMIFNLNEMRDHLSEPVVGIVGMSVLREACLRCDFDQEQLQLLSKASDSASKSVDLFFAEGGRPHVILSIGRQSVPVMIDLGSESGLEIPRQAFDDIDSPLLRTIGSMMTSGGIRHSPGFKSATVRLGETQFAGLLVSPSESHYGLAGQKFLSRLNLELDFPRKRMFYKPSKRFHAKDNELRFGIVAERETLRTLFVSKGSAAHMAGIRPGDVLVSASSEFYGQRQDTELYRVLGLPQLGPTTLEVVRDGKPVRFTLE